MVCGLFSLLGGLNELFIISLCLYGWEGLVLVFRWLVFWIILLVCGVFITRVLFVMC